MIEKNGRLAKSTRDNAKEARGRRKDGINWANQSGDEDETGELKTHRDATARDRKSVV